MISEYFFHDPRLPFAEARISEESRSHFKAHMHRRFSVGVVTRGSTVYKVAEQELFLEPGRLALINPETLHSCNPEPGNSRSFTMLYLDLSWCLQVQQSLWQTEHFVPVMTSMLEDEQLFSRYCSAVDIFMQEKESLLAKEELLAELAADIFLVVCNPQIVNKEALSSQIEDLKELLGKDLEQEITMTQYAASLYKNPYTLLRRFRRETGITPHVYRMNCRIEKARELLQQGADITDTALACGFFDQSHFHHHFKAMTTVTPRQYQFRHR